MAWLVRRKEQMRSVVSLKYSQILEFNDHSSHNPMEKLPRLEFMETNKRKS